MVVQIHEAYFHGRIDGLVGWTIPLKRRLISVYIRESFFFFAVPQHIYSRLYILASPKLNALSPMSPPSPQLGAHLRKAKTTVED